jgi:hypothetical protein
MRVKWEGKTFEINEDYTIPETLFPAMIKLRDDKKQSFRRFNAGGDVRKSALFRPGNAVQVFWQWAAGGSPVVVGAVGIVITFGL